MKTKLFFIATILFVLSYNTASAQYYDNGNRGGVDRSIGQESRYKTPKNKKSKEQPDFGEVWAIYLNEELKLDGLQYAAVKSIMNENKNSLEQISQDPTMHSQEKKDKMMEIMNKIDIQISKFLSTEQKQKYQKLKDEKEKRVLTQ
ncbi:hypothetical protein D3C87_656420 [compost metagenome]|jgi:hypothetical protein